MSNILRRIWALLNAMRICWWEQLIGISVVIQSSYVDKSCYGHAGDSSTPETVPCIYPFSHRWKRNPSKTKSFVSTQKSVGNRTEFQSKILFFLEKNLEQDFKNGFSWKGRDKHSFARKTSNKHSLAQNRETPQFCEKWILWRYKLLFKRWNPSRFY